MNRMDEALADSGSDNAAGRTDGMPNVMETLQLKIGGMSCSFCANSIETALKRENGIGDVHVSLAHEEALVRFSPSETTEAKIKHTLRDLGFEIRDPRKVHAYEEQAAAIRREAMDLATAATFAIILLVGMAGMWIDLWPMRPWYGWVAWAIATGVYGWSGRRIARMAWGAAKRGIMNQHVLLSVGVVGAYIGGLLGLRFPFLDWYGLPGFPAIDFFGVVVFLTAYHLLSGWVSLKVRTKASESVRKLLDMQPPTARVVRNGREQEIGIELVAVGDLVRIRPGEGVPVDGRVVDGRSAIDEAIVTGESIPADKAEGSEVIGGSINQTGTLLVEVTRIGEDSFLHQIARHVEEAKAMKPGIIILVDRVLKGYVPVVLGISMAAFLFWAMAPESWSVNSHWVRAIYAAVTVLVMGYPCALGMATPLALIRGGGMAAERGILIRSGEAFQILKDITHVVLDKTGTVTEGKPRLVEIVPVGSFSRADVLRHAAAAEASSEHPLGRAIVIAAEEEGLLTPTVRDFRSVTGAGVAATVDDHRVLVGTARFLGEEGITIEAAEAALAAQEAEARTAVVLSVDAQVVGVLGIADTVKSDAAATIAEMHRRGITPILLTGDNARTAEAVARQVGVKEVFSEVLPDQKAEKIRGLQGRGARVAMVGDGINDAPALMQAEVGMAIGAGTDIAIESSDVVLIGNRVGAVVDSFDIGAASYRKTLQNLWLAFFFNGVGVPLATTGLVHPSWAMIAMALSVSAVLANSFGGGLGRRGGRVSTVAPSSGEKSTDPRTVETVTISVPGIHCAACVETITALLNTEEGVRVVDGDPQRREVVVAYMTDVVTPDTLREQIRKIGYEVE